MAIYGELEETVIDQQITMSKDESSTKCFSCVFVLYCTVYLYSAVHMYRCGFVLHGTAVQCCTHVQLCSYYVQLYSAVHMYSCVVVLYSCLLPPADKPLLLQACVAARQAGHQSCKYTGLLDLQTVGRFGRCVGQILNILNF